MMGILWQLFSNFFVIGLFTFGGGYAVVSLIQAKVVGEFGWIAEGTFTDILAISQMTPGPIGINCATYTGYEVFASQGYSHAVGVLGSFTATLAVVLPSFLIVLALARFYMKFHSSNIFSSVMSTLRPAVVGMIGAAALVLMLDFSFGDGGMSVELIRENFPDWKSWVLLAAGFCASWFLKLGPFAIILAAGLAGLLLY